MFRCRIGAITAVCSLPGGGRLFRKVLCSGAVTGALLLSPWSTPVHAEEPVPVTVTSDTSEVEKLEFFEKSVRPLLLTACGSCHGADTQWAGLRVDSRSALMTGGETGTAIVPGDPDASLLIQAVRRTGDYEMPPDDPLTAEQVAILEHWVRLGAPWPDEAPQGDRHEQLRNHWAFQPIVEPTIPAISRDEWCRTPVDAFVLQGLRSKNLQPSPQADRRTLIRRLTFDLTGLPPTWEEIESFVGDPDPEAYSRLVERLLASPRYAEHQARKWLDLARYADTKGYVYNREERRFVHSATYRDWVVDAFERDLPYDQFLLLQIAADQVAPDDPRSQSALGFLTLGRRFLGNRHDIIDDRIDVLGRTALGLSFGCARCHDHKYDPIPTADYYSLYGIFLNCSEKLVPVGPSPSTEPAAVEAFQNGLAERISKFEATRREKKAEAEGQVRAMITDYLFAQYELELHPDLSSELLIKGDMVFPYHVHRWDAWLRRARKRGDPVFLPWFRFSEIPKDQFAAQAADIVQEIRAAPPEQVHPQVAERFQTVPESMREVAQRYSDLFQEIDQRWQTLIVQATETQQPAPVGFPDPLSEQLRAVLYGADSPCSIPDEGMAETEYFYDLNTTVQLWTLQKEIDQFLIDSPEAPAYAMTLQDRQVFDEPRILRRGNPASRGPEVPRQLPLILSGPEQSPFTTGSGRLEVARAIVSPENPLTPRVWVNRIWQQHFGTGLVPTPSDFGTRAPVPEHAELLDWLAQQLIREGWSTKAIHRLIVLSSAYQQQSSGPQDPAALEQARQSDPENRWYWKWPAHRLSFEESRDAMLSASGELVETMGGRGSPAFSRDQGSLRRTLYGLVDRQFLPNEFRTFDFANPDLHIPARLETTVPQQALFAINHPFVADRARQLVETLQSEAPNAPSEMSQLRMLFRSVLLREPTAEELASASRFLQESAEQPELRIRPQQLDWQYGIGSMAASQDRVGAFEQLTYFDGIGWQGAEGWPSKKTGWARLTAEGGHPGNDDEHAVIRRWTAPRDLTVSVESEARHELAIGNGIRCWIVSSREGVLTRFLLHNSAQQTRISTITLQAGDTLDFVADINGHLHSDQYFWDVTISEVQPVAGGASDAESGLLWNSLDDFLGADRSRDLSPWEQLAQVLLLSNEFWFVD